MKILVVVDMQNDFITGSLGSPEARKIVSRVKKKLAFCRSRGDMVIFTRDTHGEDYLKTQEGARLPVPHCIKGTPGWQICGRLMVNGASVIDKPSFGSLALADRVAGLGQVTEVELVGLCTDICVISNAVILKACLPEARIVVDAACCAGVTPESHQNALNAMRMCQIDIVEG